MKPSPLLLTHCTTSVNITEPSLDAPVLIGQLDEEEAGGEEEPHVELFTTARTKMAAATSDFGYNLFRSLPSRDPNANVFLAPLRVSEVITQLATG